MHIDIQSTRILPSPQLFQVQNIMFKKESFSQLIRLRDLQKTNQTTIHGSIHLMPSKFYFEIVYKVILLKSGNLTKLRTTDIVLLLTLKCGLPPW